MTNTFPAHRARMPVGRPVATPAAYVRAVGLAVDRLAQTPASPPGSSDHRVRPG
jgi:hypothetical protein